MMINTLYIESLYNQNAVVIDTESTGGAFYDEIIEIGIVRAQTGKILFNKRLKPTINKINYFAEQIHGITIEDLENEVSFKDIYDELMDVLQGSPVLAYNSVADKRFLEQTASAHNIVLPDLEWICIMDMYSNYTNRDSKTNLTEACKELQVIAGNHSAVADALAAARLIYRMHQGMQPI